MATLKTRYLPLLSFAVLASLLYIAHDQQEDMKARFARMSKDAEAKGLAEPFKGVTTNGTVQTGLYSIRSTGVSTEPVRKAADSFLAALTPEQKSKTMFAVDDPEWRKWMNQHFYVRQGVSFLEMTEAQRNAGFSLMRAALSAKGLKLSRDIMHLNESLGELNGNDFEQYGEYRYYITVMGKPSPASKDLSKNVPWGFQIDGHHLIVNYFVLGDQVVVTPFFVGSEPVTARSGKYQGTSILQDERNKGLAMINALSGEQRQKAIIQVSKTGNNNVGEAFKDNVVLDYAGVRADSLTPAQREQLLGLVNLFVSNIDDGHARVKMDEVKAHLDRTWFAWIGGTEQSSVFYYRVHSPVVLLEFDHQLPANYRPPGLDPRSPSPEHIHAVVRTPNGNDYGKDLLRLHYLQYPHPGN